MRKVLSLVLVAVLALGMGMTAFASLGTYENIKAFATGQVLGDGVQSPYSASLTTNRRSVDMGTVYAMDEPKLVIDLWTYLFDGVNAGSTPGSALYYMVNLDAMISAGALPSFGPVGVTTRPTNWNELTAALTANYSAYNLNTIAANASLTSNTARAAAAFNMYWAAGFVTTTPNATHALGFYDTLSAVGAYTGATVSAGTSSSSSVNRVLTSNEITKSKITMGTTVSGDSSLIRSLLLEKADGQIVLKLLKEFVSVVDKDVEVEIYLAFDGKRANDQSLTVFANLDNPTLEVYANHDRVDIAKGYIAKAYEFNTGIAVYTGNGVTVHTKMFKDKKYYCIAVRDADQADTRVFNEYRDVDNVITMKAVGLNNSDSYVTLSNDYSGYWVYDGNMNYLGRGDERLEYCAKYYLANKELDIASDEEEEEEEEYEAPTSEAPAGNPGTGGSPAATNANLNPGTGR